MEIFENNMLYGQTDENMAMPYPYHMPEHMPIHDHMHYSPMDGMPCPYPMPPTSGPMPMPCPPMNGMPMPEHMPYPPMNGMPMPCPMPPTPGPMPMPPMPIEDCDEEMLHNMEKMYCMHMYMAAMNKMEAYKHKMMHCYCKNSKTKY